MHGASSTRCQSDVTSYTRTNIWLVVGPAKRPSTPTGFAEQSPGEMREIARRLTGLYALIETPGGSVTCTDDVSGAPLDEGLVRQARALEMKFFETMGSTHVC